MTATFRSSLPEPFVANTLALCGNAGANWLDRLPEIIGTLEKKWSIAAGKHFPNIEYNYVAAAECADGTRAVLKIALPLRDVEIYGEAKYLWTLGGRGAVKLLKEDRELQAILIERAQPGDNMADLFHGREPEAVGPAIALLRSIRAPKPHDLSDIILLDDWFSGLRRYRETQFPEGYAPKALEIYDTLSGKLGKTFYLHGDFHPGNIVSVNGPSFVVIDPKGIVGHIGYEIAVFLNNFHWWQETKPNIKAILDTAVLEFAAAFELDPFELRQWAFAQMVLSAWWMFDEMPEIYDNEVVKADLWDV